MKYLALVYIDEDKLGQAPADECLAYADSLKSNGHCLAAEALRSSETATTLRLRNGKLGITDGPFAETKEQLAGFYLLDARDLNEAIQMASRIPPASLASIEVRPVWQPAQPPQ